MPNTSTNNLPPLSLIDIYRKLYSLFGPQGWWPGQSRFEIIAGAILTQNTAWPNVEKAIKNLKAALTLSDPLSVHSLSGKKLARLIRPAGYYNVKSRRLKNFTRFLIRKYDGSLQRMARTPIGRLRNELLAINGIGPETCDSILLYAFGRPVFVVDAYTKRIFSRHGLFPSDSAYESIQKIFTDNLPSDEKIFNEYHALIVRLGKDYCKTKPRGAGCPLKERKISCKRIGGII